jgi:outer membrane protein insertion porin family
MPTEGHLIELAYEQVFGSFDYPRGTAEYSQYFLLRQRPDGSGRHTLAFTTKAGFSGSDTPIFEHYFAGGFSTLRGFQFRGASPIQNTVRVGGEFQWLNSVEYFFPITADDMVKGTVFCDFGTVERKIALDADNFRVAPGVGLRINVPALGPAPLAFDFAFPVASAAGDREQVFSFFFGAMR